MEGQLFVLVSVVLWVVVVAEVVVPENAGTGSGVGCEQHREGNEQRQDA